MRLNERVAAITPSVTLGITSRAKAMAAEGQTVFSFAAGEPDFDTPAHIKEEGVSLRGTFIIDPDGVLKAMEIHDNSIGRSAKEILRKVQAAKFVRENPGNVCPAAWEPGKETLKPGLDLVGKI